MNVLIPIYFCYFNCESPFEVWPGYHTAIARCGTGEVLLNIDTISKVLRQQNVLESVSSEWRGKGRATHAQDFFTKKVVGQIVMTRYVRRIFSSSNV